MPSKHHRPHKILTPLTHFIEGQFLHSWWIVVFILICYFFYEQGLRKRDHDHANLLRQYHELVLVKKDAEEQNLALKRRINSQANPETVELILMKDLGLVPEGQTKVVFIKGEY